MENEPLVYITEPEHAPMLPPGESRFVRAMRWLTERPHGARIGIILAILFGLSVIYGFVFSAPGSFPANTVYAIARGDTVSRVAPQLAEAHIIRHPFVFKALMALFGGASKLQAGDYYLAEPQGTIIIAWRFSHGTYEIKDIRVTIPEGWNSTEIAAHFSQSGQFVHFDPVEFEKIAAPYEGYLFPDTYLFLPSVTAPDVLKAMTDNYKKRIQTVADEITAFGRPIKDVISMASIVEEEARTDETRRIIAGILWKRLDQGMPLQVDAAFAFVNGKKASEDLTLDDLKIDSPYNTYVHKGLPPTPISNPGLAAIKATINPTATVYYYYLSDKDGNMHYAATHDEHVANKEKYLR